MTTIQLRRNFFNLVVGYLFDVCRAVFTPNKQDQIHCGLRRTMVSPHGSREASSEVRLPVISDIDRTTPADLAQKGRRLEKCVTSLENKLTELPEHPGGINSRRASIWRVHEHLKKLDPESYEPKMVSIGPLHRGKSELSSMESAKLDYLRQILKESDGSVRDLFDGVLGSLANVRLQYSEEIYMPEEDLAEMLVVDGCFIIAHLIQQYSPHAFKDFRCLRKDRWDVKNLRSHLLLLENQIPFFVLDILCQKINLLFQAQKEPFGIMNLALKFLQIEQPQYIRKTAVHHLLHLQHICQDPWRQDDLQPKRTSMQLLMIPIEKLTSLISASFYGFFYLLLFNDLSRDLSDTQESKTPRRIPGAMELHQAGIKFKAKAIPEESKGVGELKVSFRDGTLEIPAILVSDSTSSKLRNLIAFEQCYRKVPFHYTDYCVFMDHLINTAEDVAILQRYGILESMLGSDSEVADMFNGLCKKVLWDHERNYLAEIYKEVVNFCRVPQHRWRANLLHNYFHSPWTVFSVMAGIILVTFTVTQTVFTIYPRK